MKLICCVNNSRIFFTYILIYGIIWIFQGLTYDDFIQTTKVLYTPIDEKEISENPIYRSYFNRYFINQVHRKITTDTEKASSEYAKFTMEFDRDYFRKVPTNTSRYVLQILILEVCYKIR